MEKQATLTTSDTSQKDMTRAERAGLTQEEWNAAIKFDSTDWGWICSGQAKL